MATIGSLSVSVSANTKKFNKRIKNARKVAARFAEKIKVMSVRAAKFGAALGAVALASLSVFIRKQMDAIDATGKLSDRLGIATEDLQRLRFAAKITGSDAGTLDKSMEQLSKRLGEAAQGLGTGKDGLKALGLELDTVLGKDPAEQFKIIAEEIANLGTQEERVAVATQLFGRSGVSLVNTLALGREGIEKLSKQADRLGLAYSRVDAGKVEAANDAMTRLSALWEGVIANLTIKFAPMIEKAINKLVDFGSQGEGAANKIGQGFEFILRTAAKLADMFSLLTAGYMKFSAGVQKGSVLILKGLMPVLDGYNDLLQQIGVEGVDTSPIVNQIKLLEEASKKSGASAGKAFSDFLNSKTENEVNRFFRDMEARATNVARQAANAANQYAKGGKKLKKIIPGGAKEVVLGRITVRGLSSRRSKEVFDPQLKETNQILSRIERRGFGRRANVAVAQ